MIRKWYARLILFLAKPISRKPLPSGQFQAVVPPVRPVVLTFYSATKIYVSNCDPSEAPIETDHCKYWLNGVTTQIFGFDGGVWRSLEERSGRTLKIEDREFQIASSPQEAMNEWFNALPKKCPVCWNTFLTGVEFKIPNLDSEKAEWRSVCETCHNRYHALVKNKEKA